jgi:Na+/H+ antiporter NhaD/arsenite permease-like protein
MLVLVVVRPRGWNEAWWTVFGAAAMLVLGLVSPQEAIDHA